MKLNDTIELMNSKEYKERFKAEYLQTKIRYEKLHAMTIKYEARTLDFEPSCSLKLLKEQKSYMGNYLRALEIRAEIEGIDLKKEKENFKFTDETGYILISEIIKAHTAEHNQDKEVMQRCEQALQILDLIKED